jgi:hypothetical protein
VALNITFGYSEQLNFWDGFECIIDSVFDIVFDIVLMKPEITAIT